MADRPYPIRPTFKAHFHVHGLAEQFQPVHGLFARFPALFDLVFDPFEQQIESAEICFPESWQNGIDASVLLSAISPWLQGVRPARLALTKGAFAVGWALFKQYLTLFHREDYKVAGLVGLGSRACFL
jgi:hypothetical protein